MPVTVTCQNCRKTYRLQEQYAGRKVRCPGCGAAVAVPELPRSIAIPIPRTEAEALHEPNPFAGLGEAAPAPRPIPRRRRKRKLLSASLAGLLVVGGGVALLIWHGRSVPKGLSASEWKYLPGDCQSVESIRPALIRNSKVFQEHVRNFPKIMGPGYAPVGPSVGGHSEDTLNIGSVRVARLLVATAGHEKVCIATTDEPITAQQALANRVPKYEAIAIGPYTLYEAPHFPEAFCVPESHIFLIGPAVTVRKVLGRNAEPDLSPALRSALREADFSSARALAADFRGWQGFPLSPWGLLRRVDNIPAQAVVSATRYDDYVTCTTTLLCSDDATARLVADRLEQNWQDIRSDDPETMDRERRTCEQTTVRGAKVVIERTTRNSLLFQGVVQ